MNKKIRFSLLTLLVMLCGTVFADEQSSLVFTAACGGSGTASDGATWTVTSDGSESNFDNTKGIHYGTGSAAVEYIKLSTSDITGTITKVVVNASTASNVTATVDVTVGGSAFGGDAKSLSATATDYTFEGSASGEIIVNIKKPSSATKALYVKSIEVTYATAAPEPTGYTVDFNTAITTSSHDFAVASKWKHIVEDNDGSYVGYKWDAAYGTGEPATGGLLVYSQKVGSTTWDMANVYDLLVTPKVSGTIKLKVKAYENASSSTKAFVQLYSLNGAATAKADMLKEFQTEIPGYSTGNGDWVELTYDVTESQRIGIRAQYVYIDDFCAEAVDTTPEAALVVSSVMDINGNSGTQGTNPIFEQQADGNMKVVLKVTLTNTGDIDFVAGTTSNYTLTPAQKYYGDLTYYEDASIAIPEDIAIGESKTFNVEFTVPYVSGYKYWYVRENVTGTTSTSYRYATSVAYEPNFVFRAAESTSTSSLSGTQAFGLISEETTKNFEIANTGTAPLTIKSITLPDGFTSANIPEITGDGLTIAKGATQALDITLPATTQGAFSGNLTIVYLDKNAAEQTYTLAFSGNVLSAGTWAADFNGADAIAYPAGSVAEGGINSDYQYADGAYNYYIKGRTTSSYASGSNSFITPKLHATAGQQLTFDVKGAYGSSYYAKVYVSTDRKTWGDPVAYFTYGEKEGAEAIGSSDWVNKSVTFDAEGDYYVAFSLYGEFKIDNIIGLTKVDVAHDLYIKSVNWPDASIKSGASQTKPSLDVIPLTDETAEAYTVKYVCGETVLAEATPVALTTSASSSKTFSFSWTPTVESTTAYPGSKIVFEFTDGTKIESEGFDLTVTNEPKFHFVKTLPSSKWSEPSDVSTPIAFGKTNNADKQTFYVYNWGSAPLTVKSITVPAGFTATPAEQFIVPAFNENDMSAAAQAVEITFSATEAGVYSDSMVVTYLNGVGEENTFKLLVSGTKLDPTKFYANFGGESNQWPAGSVYQSNVSTTYVNTNDYAITSSSTTNNIFVTPKLTAAAGDKLLFDAKLYSSYWNEGKVVVYAAATREEVLNAEEGTTRQLLFQTSGQGTAADSTITTDFKTFEVTVPTAGDYFFGFEISNRPYVDEIYGLKTAAVAHDLKIASSSIPTTGMQNNEYTASVNIQNFGIANEAAGSYEMNVYVNNELMASGNAVAIPMNHKLDDAGTAVAATFRYPKVGTFPVYVEVKAGDYSVKTDTVDVVFAEEVAKSDAEMAAGSPSNTNLLHMNWNNSESVSLYSKAVLEEMGLVEGSKIASITYKGYNVGSKNYSSTLNVWYEFTDDETLASPAVGKYDTSAMTNVLSTTRSWATAEGSADNLVDLITINFETPIVYTGKGLKLVVRSEADNYQSGTYFVQSTKSGSNASFYHRDDTHSSFEQTNSWSSNYYLPAISIGLSVEPTTISGTVKNAEGAAVEGAIVTLTSNDGDGVEYTGKTDAEGAYSINVIQTGRQYNVEVDAEGYESASAIAVSFAEGSVTKDFVIDIPLVAKYIDNPFFTGTPIVNGITTYAKDATEGQVSQMQAVNGWQFGVENGDARASGVFAIGGSAFLGGAGYVAPAVGAYDETKGNVLGLVAVWSGTVQYTNKTVTLQPGTYTLTVPVYNAKGGTTVPAKSLIGFIADNGTEYLAPAKSYAVDKWTYETVSFNLSEETTGKFSLGYTMTNVGSGSAPHLFIGALSLEIKTLLDGVLDELTAELTYAYSLKTEDRTAGLEAFDAAILTAEGLLESTDVAAIKAGIEALQAAENAFVIANMPIAEGKYYIYNIGTQKYLAAGANWGTHAVVNETGVDYEFAIADGKYTLDSQISNGGDNHFLNGEWNDGAAMGWTFTAVEGKEGVYTISNGEKFLTAAEDGKVILGTDATADAAQWTVKTLEARIAELATATVDAPVDATFLIQDANFGRNDLRKSAWKMEASNQNLSGGEDGNGSVGNNCAESYHAVFTLTQTLTNVPAGKYKMTAQGFYRQDGDAVEDAPVFYANAKTSAFPVKTGSENSMTDASKSFSAGNYTIEPIEVVVGEDSILTIGAKGTATSQWVIWDNFRLSYYGEEPVLAGDANLNGEVTTSDAVAAVSFVLETETPSAKAFKAADVDNSGNITVADAVAIVNIALEIPEPESSARGEMETVNFLTMNGNALELMNTTEFVGFQMDVTLANGAMLNGVSLAERAAGLQVAYNRIADNTYRIIAFSTSNAAIEGNEGTLFSLDITGNANISITNVEFADAAARAYALGFGETTGIKGIYAGATNVESYTVGGVKNDKVRKGMNIVRTADGKVKKVFVK